MTEKDEEILHLNSQEKSNTMIMSKDDEIKELREKLKRTEFENRLGARKQLVTITYVFEYIDRQTDRQILIVGICCFSAKHATLRSKSKDWLGQNQNNVSEWSDMSVRGLLFQ